jgi:uncharacterized HAD superfamily protein
MRISFDFDGTLTQPFIQHIAQLLNNAGHDIYLITSRCSDENMRLYYEQGYNASFMNNKDLFSIAEQLKIPKDHIIFTNLEWKGETLEEFKIDIHFDDNEVEQTVAQALGYNLQFIIV